MQKKTVLIKHLSPSVHMGLYKKFGYRYFRNIINYGNETDRLYVKEQKF